MKANTSSIIFGIAIIVSSIFLGRSYVERKKQTGKIQVTGLGKADFTSDLIIWEGVFVVENSDLKQAYLSLKNDKKIVGQYLDNKGISSENLVFSAVNIERKTKNIYSENGNFMESKFIGYKLSQTVQIESKKVNEIEKISREITELLNRGVRFYSESPRYYYTKLADLKIEMISKATQNAKLRADKIAEFSDGKIGDLLFAKMGVFQITGQNSGENYSWGGAFNTSSKEKTASITMKLTYKAK